ncbi:MAG TPA: hypothetical protein VIK32_14830 [Candidatus Limnocylindrales bacterium]|jgi:hypothetical protein
MLLDEAAEANVSGLCEPLRTSRYQWRVIATDPTGHRTVGAAHTLRVLPNHDRR